MCYFATVAIPPPERPKNRLLQPGIGQGNWGESSCMVQTFPGICGILIDGCLMRTPWVLGAAPFVLCPSSLPLLPSLLPSLLLFLGPARVFLLFLPLSLARRPPSAVLALVACSSLFLCSVCLGRLPPSLPPLSRALSLSLFLDSFFEGL